MLGSGEGESVDGGCGLAEVGGEQTDVAEVAVVYTGGLVVVAEERRCGRVVGRHRW